MNKLKKHGFSEWSESFYMTDNSLEDLFENRIPFIRINQFIPERMVLQLANTILKFGKFRHYPGHSENSGLLKFGPVQCEYDYLSKKNYFAQSKKTIDIIQKSQLVFNPVLAVMHLLRQSCQREVSEAIENDGDKYHVGTYHKIINTGMNLHMDFAPYDANDWSIDKTEAQLSWVLHLMAPLSGGATVIHRRLWQPEDEVYHVTNSYHYDHEVVSGVAAKKILFHTGDLILFNSRNYHEILQCKGTRLTVGSFIGKSQNEKLVLWS